MRRLLFLAGTLLLTGCSTPYMSLAPVRNEDGSSGFTLLACSSPSDDYVQEYISGVLPLYHICEKGWQIDKVSTYDSTPSGCKYYSGACK